MTRRALRASQLALAAAAAMLVLFANDNPSPSQGTSLVTQAQARVGRPATPGSVAGVARRTSRRTTRRAVGVGAAATYGAHCYRNAHGTLICP